MDASAVERRLAAILAADVVGYSRLVEQDEAGTLAAIRKLRAEVIDPLLAKHHGRIVKLMGDGAIAEFGSVVDAVACAVAVQKEIAARAGRCPGRAPHRLPHRRQSRRRGGRRRRPARRRRQRRRPPGAALRSGGVLISGTAYDHLQGKLDLPLDFAGEQQVKNIARPVRAYRVRLDGSGQPWRLRAQAASGPHAMRRPPCSLRSLSLGGGFWWMRPVEPASAKPSIAVLPFDNLGGDEATGRLADGITEDIITDLARFRELDVIARNSTMVYKGKAVDMRQVGRDLNVRYVLEGSIQRQGDRVRVTAQLIEAASGAHVWSERWDRPVATSSPSRPSSPSRSPQSSAAIPGIVIAADREAAKRKRPSDLTAYDLYLLGVEAKHRETKESVEEAIRLLKRSLEIDPNLRAPGRLSSWSYCAQGRWADDWKESHRLSLDAAKRAVELDPLDAEAHAALGDCAGVGGRSRSGGSRIRQGAELEPELRGYPHLLCRLGQLVRQGRGGRARGGARDPAQSQHAVLGSQHVSLRLFHGRPLRGGAARFRFEQAQGELWPRRLRLPGSVLSPLSTASDEARQGRGRRARPVSRYDHRGLRRHARTGAMRSASV